MEEYDNGTANYDVMLWVVAIANKFEMFFFNWNDLLYLSKLHQSSKKIRSMENNNITAKLR